MLDFGNSALKVFLLTLADWYLSVRAVFGGENECNNRID